MTKQFTSIKIFKLIFSIIIIWIFIYFVGHELGRAYYNITH